MIKMIKKYTNQSRDSYVNKNIIKWRINESVKVETLLQVLGRVFFFLSKKKKKENDFRDKI